MKKLMNLKGVKALNKSEQKSISGGKNCGYLRLFCSWNGVCLHYGPQCAEKNCGGTPIPTSC